MRRLRSLLPWLTGACLLLSSCAATQDEPVQKALDFRVMLLGSAQCAYTAEVSADFGERIYEFTLECAYNPKEDTAELTVTEPEPIAGVRASTDGTDGMLEFEEVSLALGTVGDSRLAPMQLPQLLGDAWAYGYIESQTEAGDGCQVTYRTGYDEDELLVYTWFDADMAPVRAEIYCDELCVLSADIAAFSAEPDVPNDG